MRQTTNSREPIETSEMRAGGFLRKIVRKERLRRVMETNGSRLR